VVTGPDEVAQAVLDAAAVKPVVAYTGGMMASAAYWIGSAADVIVASPAAVVGSIGIAAVHYDKSEADKAAGVRRTIISAGAYKRIAADNQPLSREGEAYIQERVDRYYSLFVDAVAAHRGVSVDQVLERMADGRDFIGEQAREAGLVDVIGNFETALALARGERSELMPKQSEAEGKAPAPQAGTGPDVQGMTLDQFKAARPDLVEAISADVTRAATTDERARVSAILEHGGTSEAAIKAVKDGVPEADAYKAILAAERGQKSRALQDMEKGLDGSAGASGKSADKGGEEGGSDFMAAAKAYAKDKNVPLAEAVLAVAKDQPELHDAWVNGLRA
jgi:signal peptide peptidase SppA